jgi:plastocyanin
MPALLSAPTVSAHAANESHHTWYVHVGLESSDHTYQIMSFSPSELWINEGDTVVWRSTSAEIHTITFTANGAPPPQPFTGTGVQVQRTPGSVYMPGTFFNSAPLADLNPALPFFSAYSLTFKTEGTVTYYCWVHPMMSAKIHVNEEGTAYPHTQSWYDHQAATLRASGIATGVRLFDVAEDRASNHWVAVGIGNNLVDVMRFIRPSVTIHVGQKVTFTNLSFGPHTVGFGPEIVPPPVPIGNPGAFDGSGSLSSGFLFNGQSFTVTFTKAGTYHYFCALHDYMGMVGVVHVED